MHRAISRTLLALAGVLLCAIALWRYVDMRRFQAAESHRLELAVRANLPATPKPEAHPVPGPVHKETGSLVGRIQIPRLKLSAIVLEGSDEQTLRLGVGRVPETAEPGSAGNVVLAAHRDTLFRPLRGIRPGDEISLTTPQGIFRYTVDWTEVVNPENIESLKATPQPSLTLVTCYPFHYIGPAPQRFIVRARQASSPDTEAKAPPPPSVSAVASAAQLRTPLRANRVSFSRSPRLVKVVNRFPKQHLTAARFTPAQPLRKHRTKQHDLPSKSKHSLWHRPPNSY